MSDASLKSNIAEIIAKWKKKPALLKRAMEKGLMDGMRQFEGQRIIKEQLSGRKSSGYGLKSGSGIARNSINVYSRYDGDGLVAWIGVGSNAWYLKVHQHYKFDGYIKPRNAGALAIPINPAAKGRSPRDFGGSLVFIKRPGKAPLLIRKVTKGKKQTLNREDIMFVLKKRVYIPKRLYFFEEFRTYGKQMITNQIYNRIKEAANAE